MTICDSSPRARLTPPMPWPAKRGRGRIEPNGAWFRPGARGEHLFAAGRFHDGQYRCRFRNFPEHQHVGGRRRQQHDSVHGELESAAQHGSHAAVPANPTRRLRYERARDLYSRSAYNGSLPTIRSSLKGIYFQLVGPGCVMQLRLRRASACCGEFLDRSNPSSTARLPAARTRRLT